MLSKEKHLIRKIKRREQQKLKLVKSKAVECETTDLVPKTHGQTSDLNNTKTELTTNGQLNLETANPEKDKVRHLSDVTFDSLREKVSEKTLRAVSEMGLNYLTKIQEQSLPSLLDGRNIMGIAKTGSGKTLAFLIPAIELISKLKFKPRNGTGAIVLSPTRELAIQSFGVLKSLMKYHHHTYSLLIGGANRQTEAQKLSKGVNILISTPGRLLDHMRSCPNFVHKNLHCLIIDEADRMLDIGFEQEMAQIINLLPTQRQTMLFSATMNEKTKKLLNMVLKTEPLYIGINDDTKAPSTVSGLQQGYSIIPSEKRLIVLFTFLSMLAHQNKKVMVFFSSRMSVQFHHDLFNYIDLQAMAIFGKQDQNKRSATLFRFCSAKTGILLCTNVAARGLDIPNVDWIIQYDPPSDANEYIHRVGRTARGEENSGRAKLFLRSEELDFLGYLHAARVPLNKFGCQWSKLLDIEKDIQEIVGKNFHLHSLAKDAFTAFIRAYESHHLKHIFNVHKLDMTKVALSFGLRTVPSSYFESNNKKRKRT